KARQYLQAAASTYHLATELPQIPNLFTMFDLQPREGQTVIRHTFAQLRSQHEASRQMLDHGTVYFLGQPLAERNIVTSEQAFNKMVCRVREHYPEKRFVYVRHRSEDLARCRRTI